MCRNANVQYNQLAGISHIPRCNLSPCHSDRREESIVLGSGVLLVISKGCHPISLLNQFSSPTLLQPIFQGLKICLLVERIEVGCFVGSAGVVFLALIEDTVGEDLALEVGAIQRLA